MDKFKETLDTWNKLAPIYQDKFMDVNLYDETYDYICKSVTKPNAKLLEIGCGPGNITKYLLSKRSDFEIFGIDIAPNMIELAQKNNPKAKFAVMDSRQIKELDKKYDGIIGGFCLPYLSPLEGIELISEAYKLLNENGLLYLSFVEGNEDKSGFKAGIGGRVYFHYHSLENLKYHLINSNFDSIETFKVNFHRSETNFEFHTILTAKKKNSI
jgi:predicted TPR repeat methyltransferase